jgi:hypothetical protein
LKVHTFEQSVLIKAGVKQIERCFTSLELLHCWLNPLLHCQPMGEWSTTVGSKSYFMIQLPWLPHQLAPTLHNTVVERAPGLIVWQFLGFFHGTDRWQCHPYGDSLTLLVNQFQFVIPHPLIAFGFHQFAAPMTKADMQAQLNRLQGIAEGLNELHSTI